MKNFGIDTDSLYELTRLMEKHLGDLKDARVWLFGSRAKGSHKKNSDIDLTISSRSKEAPKRLNLLRQELSESNVPYIVEIVYWPEMAEAFLTEVRKTRIPFWDPSMIVKRSPWRICPIGEHWVREHPRKRQKGPVEDVDGHCRKNPSGKDWLHADEIQMIPRLPLFQNALKPHSSDMGFKGRGDKYDDLIAGWTAYWNAVFEKDPPLSPDLVKLLIATESSFRPKVFNRGQEKKVGIARGLGQITEETWKLLRSPKEIKDHYLELSFEQLDDPNLNIAALVRWIIRKRETAKKSLRKNPTPRQILLEYKGIRKQNPKHPKVKRIIEDFETLAPFLNLELDQ